jgi:hypothetical protein
MGIDPMNKISIIIRILFAVTLFQQIEHEVFVEQPDGFVLHNKGTHVCKLRKALYGLK